MTTSYIKSLIGLSMLHKVSEKLSIVGDKNKQNCNHNRGEPLSHVNKQQILTSTLCNWSFVKDYTPMKTSTPQCNKSIYPLLG